MKDFGRWVRELRQKQGLDLRAFGHRTSVDPSTISRIENGHTQATLYTAVRICVGVGITLHQFSESLGYTNTTTKKVIFNDAKTIPVLTLRDLVDFTKVLGEEADHALQILSDLINIVHPPVNVQEATLPTNVVRSFGPAHFSFLLSPNPVFKVTLQYPPNILAKQILRVYQLGGILNLSDVGAYLRDLRHEKKATVAAFTVVSKLSAAVITKLELGTIENIKLSDVVELDTQLSKSGEIIALYWEAITLNVKIVDLNVNPVMVNLLVIVARWLQSNLEKETPAGLQSNLEKEVPTWLTDLRRELH